MAAISFEINRGKGNRDNFEEYDLYSDSLLFDKKTKEISDNLAYNKDQSALFAQTTFDRFLTIYKQTYEMISCIFDRVVLSPNLKYRKQLFTKIIESTGAKAYFATEGGNEFEVIREQDWARDWIGIGIVLGDYYACLEWEAVNGENDNPVNVEIGIRKAPTSHVTQERRDFIKDLGLDTYQQETNNGWWYYWRDGSKLKEQEKIDEILRIASLIENRLKTS